MQDPAGPQATALDSNESLVRATLDGCLAAFGLLVERHWKMVVALVRSRIADPTEAEDVAQESFLKAHAQLHTLRDPVRFPGWLCKIALQQTANALRKRRRHQTVLELYQASDQSWGISGSSLPPPGLTMDQAQSVRQAVGGLPDKLRTLVVMRFVAGLSSTQIAAQLGQRPGTVRIWLHRAYKVLRTELAHLLEETDL